MMKMRSYLRARRGSSLIITLLIISVISTISFAITALAISEFRKASNLQDSIAAYYAAESGIEHGLMQYRLWHNAEISKEVYDDVLSGVEVTDARVPTKDQGQAQTFRLSGSGGPGYVPSDGDKGTSWYDLKMFYRDDVIGALDGSGNPVVDADKSPRIYRDSALQISTKGADALRLAWRPDPGTKETPPAPIPPDLITRYFVEIILTSSTNACPLDREVFVVNDFNLQNTSYSLRKPFGNCEYDTVRIKPWNMQYMQYSLTLENGGSNISFDSRISHISSTGYFGKAKRLLEINLNRVTGTILESEDFLFLSGDDSITF